MVTPIHIIRRDIKSAFESLLASNRDMASPRYGVLTKDEVDDLVGFMARIEQNTGEQDFPMSMIVTIFALRMESKMGGPNREPDFLSAQEYEVFAQLMNYYMPLIDEQGLMGELERMYEDRNMIITRGIGKSTHDERVERFKDKKARELWDRFGASKIFSTKTKDDFDRTA